MLLKPRFLPNPLNGGLGSMCMCTEVVSLTPCSHTLLCQSHETAGRQSHTLADGPVAELTVLQGQLHKAHQGLGLGAEPARSRRLDAVFDKQK